MCRRQGHGLAPRHSAIVWLARVCHMIGYQHPFGARRGGWPSRRPAFLLAIALVFLVGFYAVSRPRPERASSERQPPVVGQAFIVDGDSLRMGGRSIRLDGLDAPEWDQS